MLKHETRTKSTIGNAGKSTSSTSTSRIRKTTRYAAGQDPDLNPDLAPNPLPNPNPNLTLNPTLGLASPWQSQNASFSKTNPYPTHNRLAAKLNPLAPTMTPTWFLTYHDVPELVHRWLSGLGVRDPERAVRDLADLTRRAGPGGLGLVARIAVQLDAVLPKCADPGMAIANLERFMAAVPRIESALEDLAENPRTTEILLQVFSTSQYLTEVLIRDPGLLDWLQGGPDRRDRSTLIDDLWASVADCPMKTVRSWHCAGFVSGRPCGSATTTSSAVIRWK